MINALLILLHACAIERSQPTGHFNDTMAEKPKELRIDKFGTYYYE